jgi:hypothetical protein
MALLKHDNSWQLGFHHFVPLCHSYIANIIRFLPPSIIQCPSLKNQSSDPNVIYNHAGTTQMRVRQTIRRRPDIADEMERRLMLQDAFDLRDSIDGAIDFR